MPTIADRKWFRILLTVVAFLGTVLLAGYQRRTGPSWPVPVEARLGDLTVRGSLPRSHPGEGGARIELEASLPLEGELVWRRYPTSEPWARIPLARDGDLLAAELPPQPPAGKLEYSLRLRAPGRELVVPAAETVIIRYRGDVPAWVLVPHILCMFLALMIALRASLGALLGETRVRRFIPWVLLVLVPGGLVLGPVVQKLAFGAYWTGWPFGEDWTDNKTLVTVLVWVAAALLVRRRPRLERMAVLLAAAAMFVVYLIPHSTHGSELDWEQMEEARARRPGSAPCDMVGDVGGRSSATTDPPPWGARTGGAPPRRT